MDRSCGGMEWMVAIKSLHHNQRGQGWQPLYECDCRQRNEIRHAVVIYNKIIVERQVLQHNMDYGSKLD